MSLLAQIFDILPRVESLLVNEDLFLVLFSESEFALDGLVIRKARVHFNDLDF